MVISKAAINILNAGIFVDTHFQVSRVKPRYGIGESNSVTLLSSQKN